MKPIKVLQVFTVMNRGGAETNAMNYMRAMDRSKVHFDFLVHRQEEGAYEKEIKELGGKVFRLPPVHPAKLGTYKRAVKKFFDENPGYDVIHGQLSELGVYIYEEAKRRGIPVIIAHAHNSPKLKDYDLKFIFREYWKVRMRKSVNTYFTCSRDSARWLFGNLNKQVFQINNAIDTMKFEFDEKVRKEVRENLGIDGFINLIHVGRFNKQKNHNFLIDVFKELKQIQPNVKLFLVGEGDLKEEIRKKVWSLNLKDDVEFLGLRNDVNRLLQAMDIFIFPSHYEGLGVAFIEAQASGIMSVISEGIPAEAFLIPENITVLSLKDNAKIWAKKIKGIELSPRKNVSDIIINKRFDIHKNASELQELYAELFKKFS